MSMQTTSLAGARINPRSSSPDAGSNGEQNATNTSKPLPRFNIGDRLVGIWGMEKRIAQEFVVIDIELIPQLRDFPATHKYFHGPGNQDFFYESECFTLEEFAAQALAEL